jgi:hypothetical protein
MTQSSEPNANTRINNLTEKLAIGVLALLIGAVQTQYWTDKAESKEQVKELNAKVLDLYRTSVTKQELKELEARLTANGEAIRADVRQILTFYLERK